VEKTIGWYYLSFCDTERPKGEQFLGGCYVPGSDLEAAITNSWEMKINPGGEVAVIGPIPEEIVDRLPPERRCKLLTKEEIGGIEVGEL